MNKSLAYTMSKSPAYAMAQFWRIAGSRNPGNTAHALNALPDTHKRPLFPFLGLFMLFFFPSLNTAQYNGWMDEWVQWFYLKQLNSNAGKHELQQCCDNHNVANSLDGHKHTLDHVLQR